MKDKFHRFIVQVEDNGGGWVSINLSLNPHLRVFLSSVPPPSLRAPTPFTAQLTPYLPTHTLQSLTFQPLIILSYLSVYYLPISYLSIYYLPLPSLTFLHLTFHTLTFQSPPIQSPRPHSALLGRYSLKGEQVSFSSTIIYLPHGSDISSS